MYISSCRPAEEGLQKYQTITSLPRRHDQQSGSVRLTQAAGYRDGEQVRRRPEVESNCLGCKHVLTPRSLLLAPRPAASLLGCAPVLVSRPPIGQTVHTFPPWKWEDCSGSPAKAAGAARAPVWHRGSNLCWACFHLGRTWTPPGLNPSLPSALSSFHGVDNLDQG